MRVFVLLSVLLSSVVTAQPTEIKKVSVQGGQGHYQFAVTLTHPDSGWDHYANVWQVQDRTGKVLGERILAHPHVEEQPFTRRLNAQLASTHKTVFIVAGCTHDGLHPQRYPVELP